MKRAPRVAGLFLIVILSSPALGWQSTTPEEQGMDSAALAEMLAVIEREDHAIDAVVVVRHGALVLESYRPPYDARSKHVVNSCTKSMVSALVGIAIGKGLVEGVDTPLVRLFDGRKIARLDDRKRAMTLEDVLTMRTGFDCEDSYRYRWRGMRQMRRRNDWVQYVLDLPMREDPGTRFEYCNGASLLLSALVQEKTGETAAEFARRHLFRPLGITDVEWATTPRGVSTGWAGISMRPRDMAKIGQLYLDEGRWNGKQIVPAEWVRNSTRKHTSATLQDGYGYQWWVTDEGMYLALGYAGQYIFVRPEENLVVAFVSDLGEQEFYVPQRLLERYIVPAVRSDTPLPGVAGGSEN